MASTKTTFARPVAAGTVLERTKRNAAQTTGQYPNKNIEGGCMAKQRGITLMGLIITLGLLGFFAVMAAKLFPAYVEYFSVKKMFATMEQQGDLKGSVRDIRRSYDTRNAIEDVKSVRGDDIEVSKEGGETVITATWSVKVPLVYNASACLDFMVTTAK